MTEVETSVTRRFGVIQEWLADHFAFANENTELLRDQIIRSQEHTDEKLTRLQSASDSFGIEVVGMRTDIKALEGAVTSLDTRIGRLESGHSKSLKK